MERAPDLADTPLALPLAGLVLVEWTEPPGGEDPPRYAAPMHRHFHDEEAWYVIEGTLGFLVDGRELRAGPGAAVLVPPGAPHTYWNAGTSPARYLIAMGASTKALIDDLAGPGGKSDAELTALFARHDGEFLGWP